MWNNDYCKTSEYLYNSKNLTLKHIYQSEVLSFVFTPGLLNVPVTVSIFTTVLIFVCHDFCVFNCMNFSVRLNFLLFPCACGRKHIV